MNQVWSPKWLLKTATTPSTQLLLVEQLHIFSSIKIRWNSIWTKTKLLVHVGLINIWMMSGNSMLITFQSLRRLLEMCFMIQIRLFMGSKRCRPMKSLMATKVSSITWAAFLTKFITSLSCSQESVPRMSISFQLMASHNVVFLFLEAQMPSS